MDGARDSQQAPLFPFVRRLPLVIEHIDHEAPTAVGVLLAFDGL